MPTTGGRPEPEIIPPGQTGGERFSDGPMRAFMNEPMIWPRAAYLLYAIAIFTGVPMLVGVIVAYVARAEAPHWQQTHFTFLIRTFWYFFVLFGIGLALFFVFGLGLLVWWALPLWVGLRVLRGWVLLENRRAIPQPESWLLG